MQDGESRLVLNIIRDVNNLLNAEFWVTIPLPFKGNCLPYTRETGKLVRLMRLEYFAFLFDYAADAHD